MRRVCVVVSVARGLCAGCTRVARVLCASSVRSVCEPCAGCARAMRAVLWLCVGSWRVARWFCTRCVLCVCVCARMRVRVCLCVCVCACGPSDGCARAALYVCGLWAGRVGCVRSVRWLRTGCAGCVVRGLCAVSARAVCGLCAGCALGLRAGCTARATRTQSEHNPHTADRQPTNNRRTTVK